ncbi:MAG: hypothetical protein U0441_19180 [Polyangiaceae bacterium]
MIGAGDRRYRGATYDPSKAVRTLHLWRPAEGAIAAGFDSTGAPIEELATVRCDMGFHTVDVDADGKVDLVVAKLHVGDAGSGSPRRITRSSVGVRTLAGSRGETQRGN